MNRQTSGVPRREGLITYDGLPISAGGGHHIREKSITRVWDSFSGFLDDCTVRVEPRTSLVILYESAQVPVEFSSPLKTILQTTYGAPRVHWPIAGANDRENCWHVPDEQLPEAVTWLSEQPVAPACPSGPALALCTTGAFLLREPRTHELLPSQGPDQYGYQEYGFQRVFGQSLINVRLSHRSTCSLFLSLPFTEVDDDFRAYVCALQERLPFKLSSKHWTSWHLNAKRDRYVGRVVNPF